MAGGWWSNRVLAGLSALFLALLGAAPALAQPATSPCGAGYREGAEPDLPEALADPRRHLRESWGLQNIRPGEGDSLRVHYPTGSINPGNTQAPVGGAGFQLRVRPAPESRCLSYRLRFPADFDFARGGKLPGLFGGDAPRGCGAAELSRGFSARLMWRAGGEGELYLYSPDRATRCGQSLRTGWRFPRGAWVSIAQEVVLNRPGEADGTIRLWIDGRLVLDQPGLALRTSVEARVEGLFFSTFFGGSSAAWASPRDQWAEFARFQLWEPAGSPR